MNLGEILRHVDRVKPNAFADEDKIAWLNELEATIQTDLIGKTEDFFAHIQEAAWNGTDITFAGGNTITFEGTLAANAGGVVSIQGLGTTYADYALDRVEVTAVAYEDGNTILTVPDGSFPVTEAPYGIHVSRSHSSSGGTWGGASIQYDGCTEPMLAPLAFHKIYPAWLIARINAANAEWTEYANALTVFNDFWGQYERWYARTYVDEK